MNSKQIKTIVKMIWIFVVLMGIELLVFISPSRLVETFAYNDGIGNNQDSGEILIDATPTLIPTFTSTATETSLFMTPSSTIVFENTIVPIMPTHSPTPISQMEGPIIIGYSVEKRPINVYRFGTGERAYLVIGGIHGGYELSTVRLTTELIEYFLENPQLIPKDARLYILQALNPDGLQFPLQYEGRANANGVDLNRNYSVGWQPTWPRSGCWNHGPIHAGKMAASEPETIALMAFMLENPISAVVSYHAAAPGFYVAGEPADQNSINLAEYLSDASDYPYPAIDLGCQMSGSLVDWGLTAGAAGVDLELTNHYNPEFERNLTLVLALLEWTP